MARADLVLSLVKAANAGDRALMKKTVEAMAAEERVKHHTVLAEQLEAEMRPNLTPLPAEQTQARQVPQHDLVHEIQPQRTLNDLVLAPKVRESVAALVNEHHRSELLRTYNLAPRHRVLLIGPPGNGKTSIAEAIATGLMVPLVVVRYDGLITSFLGETASRLRRLFDFAHSRKCVLFFDEFDTVGKERGDIHETGEIKRVVSSLLMQVDELPSYTIVAAATNHPELLDRAAWRRFQLRLSLPLPTPKSLTTYIETFAKRFDEPLGQPASTIAKRLGRISYAEAVDFCLELRRCKILSTGEKSLKAIIGQQLEIWSKHARAMASANDRGDDGGTSAPGSS